MSEWRPVPASYLRMLKHFKAACSGKVKQRKKTAMKEARRLTQRNIARGHPPVVAYECPHCRTWHCGRIQPLQLSPDQPTQEPSK